MNTPLSIQQRPASAWSLPGLGWQGPADSLAFDDKAVREKILLLDQPLYVVRSNQRVGVTDQGQLSMVAGQNGRTSEILAVLPPMPGSNFGDPRFLSTYGVRLACYAGAMANGIASMKW